MEREREGERERGRGRERPTRHFDDEEADGPPPLQQLVLHHWGVGEDGWGWVGGWGLEVDGKMFLKDVFDSFSVEKH